MADPLCRWLNFTPETICKIVEELPKEEMSISEFREYMQNSTFGDGFFRTVYQYACQLALYYEDSDKKIYIPRFRNNISLEEAKSYLKMWIHKYYVPNPYNNKSSFIDIQPKLLIQSIIEYIEKNGNDD
ncbi:MAG: hypothetical protein MJ211_15140 [Bacteroidales bacterium]|nr:hypothetical protein [Bacteroidales bacterium]